jgi:hypothetical protein
MSAVSEYLEKRGVAFEATSHAETYRSVDEARALGIAADEVVKALMLRAASSYRLAVLPASLPGHEACPGSDRGQSCSAGHRAGARARLPRLRARCLAAPWVFAFGADPRRPGGDGARDDRFRGGQSHGVGQSSHAGPVPRRAGKRQPAHPASRGRRGTGRRKITGRAHQDDRAGYGREHLCISPQSDVSGGGAETLAVRALR